MPRNHTACGGTTESRNDSFETPDFIYNYLDKSVGGFTIDLFASHGNAKHSRYYTEEEDAFVQDWSGETAFANCPFSLKERTIEKASETKWADGCGIVLLLPSDTGTGWFHDPGDLCETWLPKGRVQYLLDGKLPTRIDKNGKEVKNSNSKASAIMIFGFEKLIYPGKIIRVEWDDLPSICLRSYR